MTGNVYEWVNDWGQSDYYTVSPPVDPCGPPVAASPNSRRIDRVGRNRADTTQLRMAGQRLGGLCGSAGSFMRHGRARMCHAAYADTARTLARRLNQQIDSVITFLPTCQREGGKQPTATAATLVARLRSYEGALQEFREVAVLPPAQPTTPTL